MMKRHVGKIINTDQRVVVVYMQIPGRESHALVVSTDNLPLSFETTMMGVLESSEGQADPLLANTLARRMMPDSTTPVLTALHNSGLLQPIPVDQIVMLPMPNMPFPLRSIIEQMGGRVPAVTGAPHQPQEAAVQEAPAAAQAPQPEPDRFNPYGQTQAIETAGQNKGIASNLLVEASLLEREAANKREQAYRYDPGLRPAAQQAATTTVIPVTESVTNSSLEKVVKRSTRKKKTDA